MLWLAYSQVEVLPDPYWGPALVAHTVARTMGGSKAPLSDYYPKLAEQKKLTGKQLKARLILALGAQRKQEEVDSGQK